MARKIVRKGRGKRVATKTIRDGQPGVGKEFVKRVYCLGTQKQWQKDIHVFLYFSKGMDTALCHAKMRPTFSKKIVELT